MRGFRCVPLRLRHDPVFAGLTSFERDVVYSALVAQDDRHCLPFSDAGLRSEIFPERPFVALREIARAREKLVALGVFTHKRSAKKEWLEIAEQYRHAEGNTETSFGETVNSQQEEFLLPHVVKPARARKINGSRAELEQSKAYESPPPRELRAPKESGNRDAGAEKESANRFAKTLRDFIGVRPDIPEDAVNKFFVALGNEETRERGSLWLTRWKCDPHLLYVSASDFAAMPADARARSNFAAMATKAYLAKWKTVA